jgi:hypothetical protein
VLFDLPSRSGDSIMAFIKAQHAAGKRYEWNVTEPDVHISGYAVIPKRFKNWTLPLLLPKRMLDTLIGRQLGLKRTRQQT